MGRIYDCSIVIEDDTICRCQESSDAENKVYSEIKWGENIRLKRLEERRLQQQSRELLKQVEKKIEEENRRKLRNRRLKCRKLYSRDQKQINYDDSCAKIIDRRTLTHKQHTQLLATPKQIPYCVHTQCLPKKSQIKIKKMSTTLSPRLNQLSLPKAQQVLNTWKGFRQHLPQEKIMYVRNLLKKIDAMSTRDANKYFNQLKIVEKKKKKRRKKKRFIQPPQKNSKTDIDKFIDKVVEYFFKFPLGNVKHRHAVITNEILGKIVNKRVKNAITRSSKHPYCVTLYEFVDQLSLWIDDKINEVEISGFIQDDDTLTITYSGTDSTATNPDLLNSCDDITKKRRESTTSVETSRSSLLKSLRQSTSREMKSESSEQGNYE